MSLTSLFYPKSVAIVGASHQLGSVGNDLVKNAVSAQYAGTIYPVNLKGGRLYGLPVLKSLAEISGAVDLVVVAVPALFVPQILREAGAKKVKAAIVISAGFNEVGRSELEAEIVSICTQYHITLIGPNCLGLINTDAKLNTSFAPLMPESGQIAFISQSGAICSSVLDFARSRGLGFSKFISIGNKAMIGESELLEYLIHDRQTKVIVMYVEQLSRAEQLIELTTKLSQTPHPKPIIVLKSGRTAAGFLASQSHTGALSGNDAAYDALFTQTGMIRAESISELFDLAECFVHNPRLHNNRVAIITNAGGPGVLTTDTVVSHQLRMAQLSAKSQTELRAFLPAAASIKNPVDILGDADAERYQKVLDIVITDQEVDGVIVLLTPQSMTQVTQTAQAIALLKKRSHKPVVVSFVGQQLVASGLEILHEEKVATTTFPEPAAIAFGAFDTFRRWLKPQNRHHFRFRDVHSDRVRRILAEVDTTVSKLLPTDLTFAILKAYGFPILKRQIAHSWSEAEELAAHFSSTLVLKIVSPDISHKTEVGGVMINVHRTDLKKAYRQLLANVTSKAPLARITGVEIMDFVTEEGVELILGMTTHPQLGKQLVIGLGGIYTEVLKDTAWRLAPLTHSDAQNMLKEVKAHELLEGARQQAKLDSEAVIECLGRLSQLVTNFPQLQEIDINPLKVTTKGALILDARIILE